MEANTKIEFGFFSHNSDWNNNGYILNNNSNEKTQTAFQQAKAPNKTALPSNNWRKKSQALEMPSFEKTEAAMKEVAEKVVDAFIKNELYFTRFGEATVARRSELIEYIIRAFKTENRDEKKYMSMYLFGDCANLWNYKVEKEIVQKYAAFNGCRLKLDGERFEDVSNNL